MVPAGCKTGMLKAQRNGMAKSGRIAARHRFAHALKHDFFMVEYNECELNSRSYIPFVFQGLAVLLVESKLGRVLNVHFLVFIHVRLTNF